MRRILPLPLVLLLAVPATTRAYDMVQLTQDAHAYHESMLRTVGDITIEQEASITAPGNGSATVKTTVYRKGPRWRREGSMTMAGSGNANNATVQAIQVFDGQDTWSWAKGVKVKLTPDQAAAASQGAPASWTEPAPGSKIVGEGKASGRDCWIVQGPDPSVNPAAAASPQRIWIDKKTFTYVQTESLASGKTIRAVFSDFRKVQGFEMPYRTDVLSDGRSTMIVQILRVATNQGLPEELFDPERLGHDD